MKLSLFRHAMGAALIGLLPAVSSAQFVTLTSGNSQVVIDTAGADAGSVVGWTIGQQSQLHEQSWWFRAGNVGTAARVGTLGDPQVTTQGSDRADLLFSGQGLTLELRYILTGNTTTSDLAEVATLHNAGGQSMRLHLFEYDDFDLGGDAGGDVATRLNSSTIHQADGGASAVVGVVPIPDYSEVAPFGVILGKFGDSNFANLDPTLGSSGPGDSTFAFQWVAELAPNQSYIVSKDKLVTVPEPGLLAALFGASAILIRRRVRL